ncbi:hypothetical protein GCM10007989_22090 [Devosia pacifica]|uniref:Uncharacterized protein n=1 Tax=Devosia pacifica TaxID=1335967 RepID=A0A918VU85_9HYPH|nr:hypothetical protein [Devosia pacifica]GHA25968.1 hypothetical protein GCM10007989_22090 [Devosia pacifica]
MAQENHSNGQTGSSLIALEPRAGPPSLARTRTAASFVSQLLAAREQLQATAGSSHTSRNASAVGAYAAGARIAVRRMPQGYRTSRTV